jgi:hypothetical protein
MSYHLQHVMVPVPLPQAKWGCVAKPVQPFDQLVCTTPLRAISTTIFSLAGLIKPSLRIG